MPTFLRKLFESYAKRMLTFNVKKGIDDVGVMTIPNEQRVKRWAENLYADFKKAGVPDQVIQTENDIKVFHLKIAEMNNQKIARQFEEMMKPKKSADVLDLTGKKIDTSKPILGGKNVPESEAQIKTKLEGMNKKTVDRIRRRRFEAAQKAEREKMAKDPEYIPEIIDPEDFAHGGRTGTGLNYLLGEDDQNVRVPFKEGHRAGRRKFLKTMAGLAALPVVGKFFKWAKPLAKTAKVADVTSVPIKDIAGMPAWFKPLVNKVIKEGDDVTKTMSTMDREIVHATKLPESQTDVLVTQDLTTGDVVVDIGMGKHGFADGHLGQPVRLEYKAAEDIMTGPDMDDMYKVGERDPLLKVKRRDEMTFDQKKYPNKKPEEFWVEEAEFTGGHPENVKFEESSFNKFGEHGSDFSEVEKFATGKVKKSKPLKKREITEYESGKAEADAERYWEEHGDYASGGRVPLGKGTSVIDREWDEEDLDEWLHIIKLLRAGEIGAAEGGRVPLAGGRGVMSLIELITKKFGKGTAKRASELGRPESALKREMFQNFNKRLNAPKIWEDPKKVREAVDDIFSTGDYKMDAEMAAEALVENNPAAFGGKLIDDIDDATRSEIYGAVLRVVQNDLAKMLQMKRTLRKASKPTKTLEGIKKTGTIDISDPNVAEEFTRFMKETDPKGHKKIEEIVEITNFDPKGKKGHATGGRASLSSGGLAGMLGE